MCGYLFTNSDILNGLFTSLNSRYFFADIFVICIIIRENGKEINLFTFLDIEECEPVTNQSKAKEQRAREIYSKTIMY